MVVVVDQSGLARFVERAYGNIQIPVNQAEENVTTQINGVRIARRPVRLSEIDGIARDELRGKTPVAVLYAEHRSEYALRFGGSGAIGAMGSQIHEFEAAHRHIPVKIAKQGLALVHLHEFNLRLDPDDVGPVPVTQALKDIELRALRIELREVWWLRSRRFEKIL